jgi:hypothetical protein
MMTDDVKTGTKTEPAVTTKATDDVAGMKDKDIKWRAKYKSTYEELETRKATSERKEREFESKISEVVKAKEIADTKRIESEVKALAVAEGLTDLDLIKLIDTKGLSINDDGEIVGAKEAIADFKSKKPAFFAQQKKTSSSTNAGVPTDVKTQSASAYDLPDAEWKNIMKRAQSVSM